MIFLSAQPDDYYFIWQLELQIVNFHSLGIPKDKIHILIGFDSRKGIQRHIAEFMNSNKTFASIFTYVDERLSREYPSSIRPHLISKHFEQFPYLKKESLFYHDSDIIFRELPDFERLLTKSEWLTSNVKSYLGFDYLNTIGGEELIKGMAKIIGINPDLVRVRDIHVGGAQYLLNNLSSDFWRNIEKKSEELFLFLEKFNQKRKNEFLAGDAFYIPIQSWCADMWALLWSGWKENIKIKTHNELDFCWPDQHISKWKDCKILHYSGVYPRDNHKVFKKNDYINWSPIYDDNLKYIDPESCSLPLIDVILAQKKRLEERKTNLVKTTFILDLYNLGLFLNHNIDLLIKYIEKEVKTNILVLANHDIPESLIQLKNLTWINSQKVNKDRKQLLKSIIKTEHACLFPPILMDLKQIKDKFTKGKDSKFCVVCENVLYVDPFFQVLIEKFLDEDILKLHHGKFQQVEKNFDQILYYGDADWVIEILLNDKMQKFNANVINYRIEYGFRFFNNFDTQSATAYIENENKAIHRHLNEERDLVQKPNEEFCWLESAIGQVWLEFNSGLKTNANENLSVIFENLDNIQEVNFSQGLVGLGFGIESLTQDNFLAIDSDVVLEDFDNLFYASYLFGNKNDLSLQSGAAGKLLYLTYRNRNQNKNTHRYKSLIHQECLYIIIKQILDFLPLPKQCLQKHSKVEICQLLVIFSSIVKKEGFYKKEVTVFIEMYSSYFLNYFRQTAEINIELFCCYQLLSICYENIGSTFFQIDLKHQIMKFDYHFDTGKNDYLNLFILNRIEILDFFKFNYDGRLNNLDINIKNTLFIKLLFDNRAKKIMQ
ncbi:MAG: hypothetical protein LBF27_35125 [Sphingobacterium sp.]|jgi:hypothetical protein|nr:hypothetical protein [Sphingobacterium sp.]